MKTYNTLRYLGSALIFTILCLLVYAAVQQSYRTSANDPQIAIATEINASLMKGVTIQRFFDDSIDIQNSLMPFATIYDSTSQPIKSSGKLSGQFLKIPGSVFNNIKRGEMKSITTQPQKDIRLAMVILRSNHDQYIAVGRSLLEVEKREKSLLQMVMIAWIITQSVLFLQFLLTGNKAYS